MGVAVRVVIGGETLKVEPSTCQGTWTGCGRGNKERDQGHPGTVGGGTGLGRESRVLFCMCWICDT